MSKVVGYPWHVSTEIRNAIREALAPVVTDKVGDFEIDLVVNALRQAGWKMVRDFYPVEDASE